MPLPGSDRALRRMAADLASMHEEDAAAILSELNAGEREAIESLLREFDGEPEAAPPPAQECDYMQLSPWLAECVHNRRAMALAAHRVLRDCAVELFPVREDSRSGPGFLTRALSIISLGR
mgnify:CR=1 FL=1